MLTICGRKTVNNSRFYTISFMMLLTTEHGCIQTADLVADYGDVILSMSHTAWHSYVGMSITD